MEVKKSKIQVEKVEKGESRVSHLLGGFICQAFFFPYYLSIIKKASFLGAVFSEARVRTQKKTQNPPFSQYSPNLSMVSKNHKKKKHKEKKEPSTTPSWSWCFVMEHRELAKQMLQMFPENAEGKKKEEKNYNQSKK